MAFLLQDTLQFSLFNESVQKGENMIFVLVVVFVLGLFCSYRYCKASAEVGLKLVL